jgi:hypothetical protein
VKPAGFCGSFWGWFWKKSSVSRWCFCGEVVVDCMVNVVSLLAAFRRRKTWPTIKIILDLFGAYLSDGRHYFFARGDQRSIVLKNQLIGIVEWMHYTRESEMPCWIAEPSSNPL